MDDELKARIVGWVNKNVTAYIIKTGGDYRAQLTQDAIVKFTLSTNPDEAKELGIEIAELIRKRLNCERI
jgi:hypothetical protein